MRRYPFAVWAGIVFAIALSGSALYWGPDKVILGSNAINVTIGTLRAEYRSAQERLRLPAGHTWPELPLPAADPVDGTPYTYGPGVGAEWAEWYWFDMWASVAASETVPPATRDAAIRMLPGFYETSAFESSAESGYFRDIITRAGTGDLEPLEEYVATVQELDSYGGGSGD